MLRILLVLVVWGLALPFDAMAAGKTHRLKIATIVPDGTSWMKAMRKGAQEIKKRTKGRVRFRFYPGGVMGNDRSVLRKIRIGQLQGGAITGGGLSAISPDLQIYSLPFAFRSMEEVDHVRKEMDPLLIAELEKEGYVSFGLGEVGFAYLMSNQPVRRMSDLAGKKVWVPEGDRISRTAFEASGVSPIPLPLTDVLTGLQTGLINTIGSSLVGAIALQWHTRIRYVTSTPLAYLYGGLIIRKQNFDKLSEADRAVVREVIGGIQSNLSAESRKDNETALKVLKKQGIRIVSLADGDWQQWQNKVTGAVDEMAKKDNLFTPAILGAFREHLANARK